MNMAYDAVYGLIVRPSNVRLWSMSGTERARRILTKAGVVIVASAADVPEGARVLLTRGDWVVDQALVGLVQEQISSALVTAADGAAVVLAAYVDATDVPETIEAMEQGRELPDRLRVLHFDPSQPLYIKKLRKKLKPVAMPLRAETVRAAERATFAGSYKGVTDVVTKYWWPLPARAVVRWCAACGITPNMVTLLSFVLMFVAPWCFYYGHFWVGLLAAWVMTFLDTVDGKLARCTLNYSKFGDVFDHGIDLISPPFWWLAWHAGTMAAGADYPFSGMSIVIIFGGYILLRLQEGVFIKMFGMQIHVWRRVDSFFRLIVARRNPILILLTAGMLVGQPGWGMLATAVWTAISIVVHFLQILQAMFCGRRNVVSWMA